MSEQKNSEQKNSNRVEEFFMWITRGLLMANIFFLSQIYSDFQNVKNECAAGESESQFNGSQP